MKRIFTTSTLKSLIAAGTGATAALSPLAAAPAAADGWNRGDGVRHVERRGNCVWRHGERYCGPRGGWNHPRPVYRDNGNAAAAAILGIAGIAIIAGALSEANNPSPRIYEVEPDTYPPAPSRGGPTVITYDSTLEPWTREWYQWCDAHYRTFDPQTGTYHGYDGRDHFCVPK